MKKYFLVLFLTTLLIPQIVFAAWWNPFSWKVFHKEENKTQVLENRIKELEKKIDTQASTTKTVIEKVEKKSSSIEKKQEDKVQEKVVTPTKTSPKTFTTPNGAVIDEAGNVKSTQIVEKAQVKIESSINNVATAHHYFNTKKTCAGLLEEQYSECVSYAYNLPANNIKSPASTIPAVTISAEKSSLQEITDESNRLSDKKLRLNEVNLKIVDLNAKYLADIKALNEGASGRGITTAGLASQINAINNKYNTDYNILQVEYQRIQYGD